VETDRKDSEAEGDINNEMAQCRMKVEGEWRKEEESKAMTETKAKTMKMHIKMQAVAT